MSETIDQFIARVTAYCDMSAQDTNRGLRAFSDCAPTDLPRALKALEMALVELNQWAPRPAHGTCLWGIARLLNGEGEE